MSLNSGARKTKRSGRNSSQAIKQVLKILNYDIYFLRNTSESVKRQFSIHNQPMHRVAMKSMLFELNLKLLASLTVTQWEEWGKENGGKAVLREIESIINSNNTFMLSHK